MRRRDPRRRLLLVLGSVVTALRIGNTEVLGRTTVQAMLLVLALAAVGGIAWARRARRVAALAGGLALAITLGPTGAAVRSPEPFAYPPLTEEERAAPQLYQLDGAQVLIQPALGLELLAPEGLQLRPPDAVPAAPTAAARDEPFSLQWAWSNDARDRALIVVVDLTVAYEEPGDNARYVHGMMRGHLEGMGPARLVVLEQERRTASELVVWAQHETMGLMFMRVITYRHGDVLVTVTAMGPDHAQLIPVVESVRGRPEYTTAAW